MSGNMPGAADIEIPSSRPSVGRFAPSPTGPLHFGSLVAAIGSFLHVRKKGGQWLVRMEDVDKPREMPGAADSILRTLDRFGLEWDGAVLYQSRRTASYEQALHMLQEKGFVYGCTCTRKEIAERAHMGLDGPVYPGTCRVKKDGHQSERAWRFIVPAQSVCFADELLGEHCFNMAADMGDFVVRRADGLFAYQLAVVVDDAAQGVTEVVRGADLLLSTPRQLVLQQALGLATPTYLHLPLALNADGEKLSKQTLAPSVAQADVSALWIQVLQFLGQAVPRELEHAPMAELRAWALANWLPENIPRHAARVVVQL